MFVPLNIHSIKSFIGIIHFSESLKKKEEGVKKKKAPEEGSNVL